MRVYLRRSISSFNQNKLRGLLAEIELRTYLNGLGYQDRVSPGGWIFRNEGEGQFGHQTVVVFPETVQVGVGYSELRPLPQPHQGLHSIAVVFRQTGIIPYFCAATVTADDAPETLAWKSLELGLPAVQQYQDFPASITGFNARGRKYNFLRYNTTTAGIPLEAIPEEFSKENLRVTFQTAFMSEVSDVDGVLWGQQFTYPVEIKEKTVGDSSKLGPYFGLDLGPFVKLAFFAVKRGHLRALFIVREIDNVNDRNLVAWWYITFEKLAQFASWVPRAGGKNMGGGGSSVVQIPKAEFSELNAANLAAL